MWLFIIGCVVQSYGQDDIHVIEDGQAQVIPSFNEPKHWIKEEVWVESNFDSDQDGKPDRLHVFITRPFQTETKGLKLPIVYMSSPYYGLTLGKMLGINDSKKYMWNVYHELGEETFMHDHPNHKIRKKRPLIAFIEDRNWVNRGFITVYSSSPGTGLSDGVPTIGGENESLAPKAVIDWLCGRAKAYSSREGQDEIQAYWSNGKVGMLGTSYDGTLALAAATTGVEGLKAIIPIAAVSSFYDYYRSNGLVRSPGGYLGEDVDVLYDLIQSTKKSKKIDHSSFIRDSVILKGIDRKTGDYNQFWEERNYLNKLDKYTAATFIAHGFNDWNVMPEHSFKLFQALKEKAVPLQLYFHQEGHARSIPFELQNKWFTKFLIEADYADEYKVWIVPNGLENALIRDDFPDPDASEVKLFLHPTSKNNGRLGLEFPADSIACSFIDNRNLDGKMLTQDMGIHRLLFLSPILREDIHLSGTPTINIELSSSKAATNLSVWLVSLPWNAEKDAKIYENVITRSWADPQNHSSLIGTPLTPGKFVELSFNLNPDDQIIKAGQQIGLMIFSSDPEFTILPKPGTVITVNLQNTNLFLPIVGGPSAYKKAFK